LRWARHASFTLSKIFLKQLLFSSPFHSSLTFSDKFFLHLHTLFLHLHKFSKYPCENDQNDHRLFDYICKTKWQLDDNLHPIYILKINVNRMRWHPIIIYEMSLHPIYILKKNINRMRYHPVVICKTKWQSDDTLIQFTF